MDDLERHLLARAERKVLDRPLSLRAPISVGWDFDRSEAVGFRAGCGAGHLFSFVIPAFNRDPPVFARVSRKGRPRVKPEVTSSEAAHFFRVKSTLTTLEPSSRRSASSAGASFSASSCSS